jgi:hypothetical protein
MSARIDESQDGDGPAWAPDEAWIDTLQAQLSKPMLARVRRYARARASMVARAGRKVDDYYARELVQDAIADTFTGALRWHPDAISLEAHLVRAVRCRTKDEKNRLTQFHHQALEDSTDGARDAEHELSTACDASPEGERRRHAADLLAQIREHVAGDRDVLRILDAYAAGVTAKADVLAFAGMRARTYHNAHNRLVRLARSLGTAPQNEQDFS